VTALGRPAVYCKALEEEDDKMVECWQKDADGILIFVSPHIGIYASTYFVHKLEPTDQYICCCRRCTPWQ
jgi:hypothetical protein